MKQFNRLILFVSFLLPYSAVAVADTHADLLTLQKGWAVANYTLKGDAQEKAFDTLIIQADKAVSSSPTSADTLIWRGIIKSSFAGVTGGLGAVH